MNFELNAFNVLTLQAVDWKSLEKLAFYKKILQNVSILRRLGPHLSIFKSKKCRKRWFLPKKQRFDNQIN